MNIYTSGYLRAATAFFRLGQTDNAMDQYDSALLRDPRNNEALEGKRLVELSKRRLERGQALLKQNGEAYRASQMFDLAAKEMPNCPKVKMGLVEVKFLNGDYDEALNLSTSLLKTGEGGNDFIDQQKTFNWWAFFVNNKSSHGPKFEDLPVVPNAQTCIALINIYNYKPIGSKAFSTFLQSWLFSNNASQDDWNTILPSLIQVNWLFYFYKYGFMEVIPNRFVFTKDPRCLPLLRQFVESAHVFNKIRSAYHFNFAGDV